jgi:drug/metabolite transporter (DMT)-like permease
MNTTLGLIAAATALIVWGLGIIFIKRVNSKPQFGIAISMSTGLLGLVTASILTDATYPAPAELLSSTGLVLVLAGMFQFPFATIAYYASIRYCEISLAAPLTRIKVAFLALVVILFGLEPVGWNLILSALLGVIGAMMLSLSLRNAPVGEHIILGAGMALLASLLWAIGDVLTMQVLKTIPALPTTVLSLGAGLLIYSVWLVLNGKLREVWNIPSRDKLMYGLHGLFNFAIGYGAFYLSIKHLGVTRAGIITASWPLVSFVLGLAIYRESITPGKILGVILVMASVFLAILK